MNTSIRLVRCPRCRKVLLELPEISVYECGGCGTILQAKNQRNGIIGESLSAHETSPEQKYESDCASNGSNHQEGDLPSIESSSGSDTKGDQSDSGSHNSEKLDVTNVSGEPSPSTELTGYSDEMLSPEAKESLEGPLDQDAGLYKNEHLEFSREKPQGRTSNELYLSSELSSHENEDHLTEIKECSKQDEGRSSLKPNTGKYENDIEECHSMLAEDKKFSDEPQSSDEFSYEKTEICTSVNEPLKLDLENEQNLSSGHTEYIEQEAGEDESDSFNADIPLSSEGNHRNELPPAKEERSKSIRGENSGKSQNGFHQNVESSHKVESGLAASSFAVVDCHKVETSSVEANDYSVVDENNETCLEGSPRPEKGNVNIAAQGPLDEDILSKTPSPNDEHLKKTQEMDHSFYREGFNEMLETLPMNPRTPIGSMSKSPTKIYYGCDASESSYDGTEGVSAQVSHINKRKLKGLGNLGTSRSGQMDGFRVKEMQNSELKIHHEPTAPLSMFKEKNNSSTSDQEGRPRQLPESMKHSRATRSTMRSAENEHVSRMSYMSRSSQFFHGNGNPSGSRLYVSEHHPRSHSPDTILGADSEKMELLRLVSELEDKLSRTHTSKKMADGRFLAGVLGEGQCAPNYYDDLASEGNAYVNSKYSGHLRSRPQAVGCAHQPEISRLAFSGEATHRRPKIDYIYSQCCHQDWHCSTKLSPHCIYCRKGQFMIQPSHDYGTAYPTYSTSPKHYTSSDESYSWSHDMKSDNQKHNEHGMKKLHLRENYHVAKQHLRPLAGGAPMLACCHCSELLKLPADFLLFKRRCHQLRCNSCNKILKFSLQKKVHLVPYVPNASAPPPSEMDDYSGADNTRTPASTLHQSHRQFARPVSYSDDYEPSFSRSCSTEGETSVPQHSVVKITSNEKMPSGDSFQPLEDRKKKPASSNFQNLKKNSENNFENGEPSSRASKWVNPSSEIQELRPATSGSPLHWLMGYGSPRQVLFASPMDESDEEMGYVDQQIYKNAFTV